MRQCSKCGAAKAIEEFRVRAEGLRSACRKCEGKMRARVRARRLREMRCRDCSARRLPNNSRCFGHWIECLTKKMKTRSPELTAALMQKWEDQAARCSLTGDALVAGYNASLDHIIPRAQGGGDGAENLQWVTREANFAKAALGTDEFVALCRRVIERQEELADLAAACGNRYQKIVGTGASGVPTGAPLKK